MPMDIQNGCPWCERPWQGPADASARKRCERATKQNDVTFDRDVQEKVKERLAEMRRDLRVQVREELDDKYAPLRRKLESAERALQKRYKRDEDACDAAFDEGKAKARRELVAELNQKSRDINGLRKQLGDLQRKLDRKSAGELGEAAEFDLCDVLRAACQEDGVRRTGKGEAGADTVHEVRDGGVVCGTIVWERKNYAPPVTVKPEWVVTARENLAKHRAAYVVLVPNALPKRTPVRHEQHGVFVVLPDAVPVFACVLRKLLIEAHRRGLAREGVGKALQRYVASGAFERELGSPIAELRAEQKALDAEKTTTKRWWTEREGRMDRASGQITKVVEAVTMLLEKEDGSAGRQVTRSKARRENGQLLEQLH
jgi:hypothetical protein